MTKNLIFLGPPGSGKGTQSTALSEKLGNLKISTGDLIREQISLGTDLGKQVSEIVESGGLVPDKVIIEIFRSGIQDLKGGFIADGFPRTLFQAKKLDEMIQSLGLSLPQIYFFHIEYVDLEKRLLGRRFCPKCKCDYNTYSSPPLRDNYCDNDGVLLEKRRDDDANVIKNRFKIYSVEIKPVLSYYSNNLITINAAQDAAVITQDVLSTI